MKLVFALLFLLIASQVGAATKYAAPTTAGAANGTDCANAYLISSFWSTAAPGDTLYLCDGTYTGASSMITPTSGLSGTSGSPITVSAVNDGLVRINGEAARVPINLNNNDWFVIEGINVHNSSGTVVVTQNGATNNILRRIVAWDAAEGNSPVFGIHDDNNLLEDVAGFGRGRKIYSTQSGDNVTIRRAWGRWECYTSTGPKMVFSAAYNSRSVILENVIGNWAQDTTCQPGAVDQPYGILAMDRLDATPWETNSGYYGSIAYLNSGDTVTTWNQAGLFLARSVDGFAFKDVVLYQPGGFTTLRGIQSQLFDQGSGGVDDCPSTADGVCTRIIGTSAAPVTKVGWTAADSINSATTTSDIDAYASIAAMNSASANPFQTTAGTGARVCYRYQNGALTSTPLWPWPMNQRIIDAMTTAGYTTVDIMATLETIFGSIPAGCRSNPQIAGAATVDTTHVDFTFSNDFYPPLASPDHTKCTLEEDTGGGFQNRAISAGAVQGTNVLRVTVATLTAGSTIRGTCTGGAVANSATESQPSLAFTNQSVSNNLAGVAYTITQSDARLEELAGTEASPTVISVASDTRNLPLGAGFFVRYEVTVTGANGPTLGLKLRYDTNGGGVADVPASGAAIIFYGTTNPSGVTVRAENSATENKFTCGGTFAPGIAVRTANAIPTKQLNQNACTEIIYALKVDTSATPGNVHCFYLADQAGTETVVAGAKRCVRIANYQMQ